MFLQCNHVSTDPLIRSHLENKTNIKPPLGLLTSSVKPVTPQRQQQVAALSSTPTDINHHRRRNPARLAGRLTSASLARREPEDVSPHGQTLVASLQESTFGLGTALLRGQSSSTRLPAGQTVL